MDSNKNTSSTTTRKRRLGLWGSLPLSRKFLAAFGALFVLVIIIVAVSLWGLNRVQSKYEDSLATGIKMQVISQELKIAFAAARQAESDFMINRQSMGFDAAYEEYVPAHHQHIVTVKGLIEELSKVGNRLKENQPDVYTEKQYGIQLEFLGNFVDIYEKDFGRAVELIEISEAPDSGLEVNMQTARDDIDEWFHKRSGLDDLHIRWLQIQTVEKDYLLGVRHEDVSRFNELSAQFRAQIETAEELTLYEKNSIINLIDEYVSAFRRVVENRQTLWYINAAFTLGGERIDRYTEVFWLLGAELADENTVQARLTSNQTFLLLAIILVVLLIAFYIIFSVFSRQITQPIIQLTNFTRQVEIGNLEVQASVKSGDEIGELASAFNHVTKQTRELIDTLEQRVADRTKALATSAEVSRRLTIILDPGQLTGEVVNEVRAAFEYYYAQIYLLDEAGENLVLTSGTGEAGAAMLGRGHSLPKGRGLVGRAAEANASVLVQDVSQEEGWLPNDLLPETRAEAAIPIAIGQEVLGVLDVQHNLVNGLTRDDVTLLESLAGQVAISLRNARSYEESRQQAEIESLVNIIGQKIQRTTTMEDTLQTAIRELGNAIGASRVKASLAPSSSTAATEPVALPETAIPEAASDTEAVPAD